MARDLRTLTAVLALEPLVPTLKGELAHHLRNPLASVGANLEYVLSQWREGAMILPADISEALAEAQDSLTDLQAVIITVTA